MKFEKSSIRYKLGENHSRFVYKIHFIFAEEKELPVVKQYRSHWERGIFKGQAKQKLIDEGKGVILLGIGKLEKFTLRNLAHLFLDLGKKLTKLDQVGYEIHIRKELTEHYDPECLAYQIVNSLEIGSYDIRVLATRDSENGKESSKEKVSRQSKKTPGEVSFLLEDAKASNQFLKGMKKAEIVSRHVNGARYIAHLPSNYFRPQEMETWAKRLAKEAGLKITVFQTSQLKKMGMGGILAVSQGTENSARMILLDYHPSGATKTLAIVGKGLTFDTGGISLKPPSEMHEMKYDMCGAAAALHGIAAIASLRPKLRVVAAIGAAENMPDGKSYKPGDVYKAYNGLTVEVQNTDAEGRLVLGDVLSYVCDKIKPNYILDLATLTGAAIIALGHETAALLTKHEGFASLIKKASEISEDRVWELPLWDEYGEDLKSDIADLKNITGGKGAGTITGALFLSHFVNEEIPWAHLDIAGTAWRKKSSGTQCSGPTGYGVRLLVALAEILSKS